MLAASLAVGLSLGLTGSGSPHGPYAAVPLGAPPSARVVVVTPQGELATARIDGTDVVAMGSLGRFGNGIPTPSPDGDYLAAPDGTIFSISGGTIVRVATQVHPNQQQVLSTRGPFADHDRAVVLLTEGRFGSPTADAGLDVIPLSSGQPVALGTADEAAGDPQQVGAFVSVPGQEVGAPGGQVAPPDSAVQLRDAGSPAVTLITAGQAAGAVGLDPSVPVVLHPTPDPQGDMVAVGVAPASGSLSEGIVVVDRTGAVEGEIQVGIGPIPGALISWSPRGSTIAYVAESNGPEIATWTLGGGSSVRALPPGDPGAAKCIWSRDGSALLCPAAIPPSAKARWYVASAPSGPIVAVAAPGRPIAWLPQARSGVGNV